jgi:hypothetical protein
MSALVKAKLIAIEQGKDIQFMFNPNELNFSRSISLEQSPGARTEEGLNKTSFKHPNPYTLTINNILLETYENGTSVMPYIEQFKDTVEFGVEINGVRRPPLYIFTWGDQKYIKCFVKTLSYKITQFRPDGTPVRAFVSLTLEEIDLSNQQGPGETPQPDSQQRQQSLRRKSN